MTLKLDALRSVSNTEDGTYQENRDRHLDEGDSMARRSDNALEQRELFADKLMRCNHHQNGGACKIVQHSIAESAVAGTLTKSSLADIRNGNHIFREKTSRKVPATYDERNSQANMTYLTFSCVVLMISVSFRPSMISS